MMHGRRPSRHLLLLHSRFLAAQSSGRRRLRRRRRASARRPPPQPTPTEPEQKGRHLSRTSSVCKHSLCLLKCFKDVFVFGTAELFLNFFQGRGKGSGGGERACDTSYSGCHDTASFVRAEKKTLNCLISSILRVSPLSSPTSCRVRYFWFSFGSVILMQHFPSISRYKPGTTCFLIAFPHFTCTVLLV